MFARQVERPIDILLVEDNPGDIRLIMEALKSASVPNRLHAVTDGDEAIAFLLRQGKHAEAPRPDLILLDLHLPKRGGSTVLTDIKTNTQLRSIPVIILSSSEDPSDITKSYRLYANCYVRKPFDMEMYHDVVHKIDEFWFTVARLPVA